MKYEYYDGILPVPEEIQEEWRKDNVDIVVISYVNDLGTLIDYADMDECNNHVDDITGVMLTDLTYKIDYAATYNLRVENPNVTDSLVMTVEGFLEGEN